MSRKIRKSSVTDAAIADANQSYRTCKKEKMQEK